jgi:hypothetical protein
VDRHAVGIHEKNVHSTVSALPGRRHCDIPDTVTVNVAQQSHGRAELGSSRQSDVRRHVNGHIGRRATNGVQVEDEESTNGRATDSCTGGTNK